MTGVPVRVCTDCGTAHWPARLLCPGCAGRAFRVEPSERGVVEEVTSRKHRVREHRRTPVGGWEESHHVPIASVRTDLGPVVIAWSPDGVAPGETAALSLRGGAVLARRPGVAPTEPVPPAAEPPAAT